MDKDLERYLSEFRANCPDCGFFLWIGEGISGYWSDECLECGWPVPDFVVNN